MTIAHGRSCIQGIRFANVEIKSLKLISPPQFGQVALRGSGFIYSANENAVGKDSFILAVTGIISKRHGGSTIRVSVSIADPSEPAPPGSVDRPSAPPEIPQAQPQPAINTYVPSPKGATLPPCPKWNWSRGSPPPMRPPFDRSKLFCPPSPFSRHPTRRSVVFVPNSDQPFNEAGFLLKALRFGLKCPPSKLRKPCCDDRNRLSADIDRRREYVRSV